MDRQQIGDIGNLYGSLHVKSEDGRFFWGIECVTVDSWEEIPESLYSELLAFEETRVKNDPGA